MIVRRAFLLLVIACSTVAVQAESLPQLSVSFWQWRAQEQPFTFDDVPRIERPANFSVDWSPAKIAQRRQELDTFEQRWKSIAPKMQDAVREQVDYRLLGSAIARVRWELDVEQGWKRNPQFYIDQTLGSVYALLLPPPPFENVRQKQLVERMKAIPATLNAAEENLTDIREPFAKLAIESMNNLPERMQRMETALAPQLDINTQKALVIASQSALTALAHYQSWLQNKLQSARKDTAIGREKYIFFLRNVALIPYSPEQLLSMSAQEWKRSVAFESYEHERDADTPLLPLFASQQAQIDRENLDEKHIRNFLARKNILSIPAQIRSYRNEPLPPYVEPFEDLGATDDLTSPTRLDRDGVSYIHVPSLKLGYFDLSTAHDPRPIIVHEGFPGHYLQLNLGWRDEDAIRRHYYDSGANEGIGFYAEEMMLQAGLFDDSPHTRETIYSFMRLRALRVEVDVKLALGDFTIQQAADYLSKTVPMDRETALEDAAVYASAPGLAIGYQTGKIQITDLLADTRTKQGDAFSLRRFHDYVWANGNVPISLQRWELLDDASDVPDVVKTPKY